MVNAAAAGPNKKSWKRRQQEAHFSDLDSASEKERRRTMRQMSPEALDAAMKEEFEGLHAMEVGDTFLCGEQLLTHELLHLLPPPPPVHHMSRRSHH